METVSLGRTGVQVSRLCLGTMNFGKQCDREQSGRIIGRALDLGINFIDTANVYNRGVSEELVGAAIADRRDRIVLATKVNGKMANDDPNASGSSRRHVIQQCEASLLRLKTDWIDLYQLHRPTSTVPIDETLRALDDLVRSGKVRYLGTSNFPAWHLVESLWVSKELGLNRFVTEQPVYNLLDRTIEREIVPMAQSYGFALLPWSPLAGGFLSGKYVRGEKAPPNTRFAESDWWERMAETERGWQVLSVVRELAGKKGCTPSQLALAWVLQQPGITSAIIGPRSMEHLEDNVGALGVTITGDDRRRLDEVSPARQAISVYHEHDWRSHAYR